jgi:hypothetical protein
VTPGKSGPFAAVVLACSLLPSCGYVGEPLPPALNIASTITDLRVVQYGDRLVVGFTIPPLTTEGLVLKNVAGIELRAGPTNEPFEPDSWARSARNLPVEAREPGPVHAEFPIAEFVGKQVVIGVRIVNERGRASGWSNLVALHVVPAVPAPAEVVAESAPQGARVTWKSPESAFRVYRQGPDDKTPVPIANPDKPEFLDTSAQFGTRYEYLVQAIRGQAESEISAPAGVTPRDVFAPALPAGLSAVAGLGSVELVWERNTEPDLKGYRVYRAAEGREFEVLAEFVDSPAYSDRQVESGKRYRYAIRAVDLAGNESTMTASVEITAP